MIERHTVTKYIREGFLLRLAVKDISFIWAKRVKGKTRHRGVDGEYLELLVAEAFDKFHGQYRHEELKSTSIYDTITYNFGRIISDDEQHDAWIRQMGMTRLVDL